MSIVKKCKKKLIFVLFLFVIISCFVLNGYFSKAVKTIIITNAKIESESYIETLITEEINSYNYVLFNKESNENGVTQASFDMVKANILVGKVMKKLRTISTEFNTDCNFEVKIPVSYLFLPTSYIFPNIKLNVDCSELSYYDCNLKSNIKEYGINSSLITIYIDVEIAFQVVVPMMFESVNNKIEIPIAMEIINGEVPEVLLNL
jgi:hypothetical protein